MKKLLLAALAIAVVFAAFAFFSPPAKDSPDSGIVASAVQTDRADEINEYTRVVYSDLAIALPARRTELQGEKGNDVTWRTRHSEPAVNGLDNYESRALEPERPPNKSYSGPFHYRAREKV